MISFAQDDPDKLAILQRHDHFRHWNSLDDTRLCLLCEKNFSGHEVLVSHERSDYELHCPTAGCYSHVHQWVYPSDPLINEKVYADWWEALGDSLDKRAQPI